MSWFAERAPYESPNPSDIYADRVLVALSREAGETNPGQVVIMSSFEVEGSESRVLGYFPPEMALEFAEAVILAAREIEMERS